MADMTATIKCNMCHKNLQHDSFELNPKGVYFKSCIPCKIKMLGYKRDSKCPHGKQKYRCVECGGASLCEHKIQRYTCVVCKGAGVCEHLKQRKTCRECGGSAYCKHNNRRGRCKECTRDKQPEVSKEENK